MSDLVTHRCQVFVNPAAQAMFFHCDPQEEETIWEGSEDPEIQEMMKAMRDAVRCGQPAYDYVYFYDGEFWMCPEHYGHYMDANSYKDLGESDP